MIRTQILLAVRNFIRFRFYSIINLIGLGFGITVGILTLLYLSDELAYDEFHANKDDIYKVVTVNQDGGIIETNAWPVARKLEDELAEVVAATYSLQAPASMALRHEGNKYEHNIHFADHNFYQIFSFSFLEGDSSTALRAPYTVVITERMRDLYFGEQLVLGKTIVLQDSMDFTITGVVENVPEQSHIQYDMLVSFATYTSLRKDFSYSEGWGTFNVRNYVLLDSKADFSYVESKSANLYRENIADMMANYGIDLSVGLIPLRQIYLDPSIGNQFGPAGSMDRLRLIAIIGLLIITLACINFVNITTARSTYRAREVGIKKLSGSRVISIFWQFLLESAIMMAGALVLSLLLIELSLIPFNQLLDKSYAISQLLQFEIIIGALGIILVMILGAGLYPALVLSKINVADGIKGRLQTNRKGLGLRRFLVITQFVISALLMVGTLTILSQLNFMRNQNLGFSKDQILVLNTTGVPRNIDNRLLQTSLISLPDISSISFTNALPSKPGWQGQWAYDGEKDSNDPVDMEYMVIDENYLSTLGLKLLAGSNFNLDKPTDLKNGLIINESAVRAFGWESPAKAIGKKIVSPSKRPEGTVIGVVKDYHGLGLQQNIWPMAMDYTGGEYGRYYAISFTTGNTAKLLSDIQKNWATIYPDHAIDYFFLDEAFDQQYKAEDRLMNVFILFTGIGLFIALIGLLGMVAFIIKTKIKEVSIRKVHGASTISLSKLLSKEFVILIVAANLIVVGPGWYLANLWLNDFTYHTSLNPVIFVINFGLTLALAALTIGFQLVKTAQVNPAKLLRIE